MLLISGFFACKDIGYELDGNILVYVFYIRRLNTAWIAARIIITLRISLSKVYGLLTKCEFKIDGWILANFFICAFMDRDGVEIHKLAKNKNEANIHSSFPDKLGQ